MEHYKIKIYKQAKNDLNEIVQYLNTLSAETALKYYDELVEKISSLAEMPNRCPYVRDTILRLKGYRYLNVNNYVVFYVDHGDTVQIRRNLYNKRQYQTIL